MKAGARWLAVAMTAVFLVPVHARATHASCTVTPVAPTCTFVKGPGLLGIEVVSLSSWEMTVIRSGKKVVLAKNTPGSSGAYGYGAYDGNGYYQIPDAGTGERITVTVKADGPGGQPLGVLVTGSTNGHV